MRDGASSSLDVASLSSLSHAQAVLQRRKGLELTGCTGLARPLLSSVHPQAVLHRRAGLEAAGCTGPAEYPALQLNEARLGMRGSNASPPCPGSRALSASSAVTVAFFDTNAA